MRFAISGLCRVHVMVPRTFSLLRINFEARQPAAASMADHSQQSATSRVARACSGCHRATSVGPPVVSGMMFPSGLACFPSLHFPGASRALCSNPARASSPLRLPHNTRRSSSLTAQACGASTSSNTAEKAGGAPHVQLRDYQEEARSVVLEAWEREEKRRMLLVLPTG
mmetsp:Transcript_5009/g.14016  ORF Transcript_5009/g.14016 Transcript_5009/m.14016 type:complete len:169 (-) Transcript_5009:832-1338(-)